jgi:phage terminase large subunit-like protein
MVRDFHRAISTVLCGTRWQRDLTNFKSLAKAVGLGDGQFAYGVPVLQEFYALMRTLGGSTEIDRQGWTYRTYRWWGQVIPTDVQVEEITPATRNSFTLAFGFTPQQQIALEFEMRTLAAVL